jgi:hypothetical protein
MTNEQINIAIAEACGGKWHIPDYCSDLNAMHEVEENLLGDSWIGYINQLADIEGSLFGIRATARQRAEAFLRTLGKWEEVQP